MNRRGFLAGFAGVSLGAAALASLSSPPGTTEEKGIKVTTRAGRGRGRFLNVSLRTQEDKEVRFYDDLIKGKIVVINFFLVQCPDGVCPLTTANLVKVQELLGERVGRDIFFYSITLDPEHDTPEALKKYAESFGVKPGWLFLTGNKDDIERLRKSLGYVDPDPVVDRDPDQHIGMLRIGIEPLERWAGTPALTEPKQIARYISWMEPNGERPKPEPTR